ncbi:HIT family protein [Gordonia otitidis]|uniref:HIT family protein n=1 Tax=Gordonia otitidis (strain DSM 44809 / CCUG 52243 / JCM 12355 / NBRC 100426 / IFM 10032) TaxID=1108044 RepID=H5TTG2_GORO1|nr:HIT family protein [Gordonia otitidis]GAB36770.1 HIT family protein [Gordonia otitidis NBRC 100426]
MSDCIFCGIIAGDIPSTKVSETETTYAFMDINPANDGHLLVIPKQHSTDLLDIGADDLTAVTLEAQRIALAVVDDLGADGVNLLNCCKAPAWQTVFHFHLHVIPRYADRTKDRLSLPWQPGVAGDQDVMSGYAEKLSAALHC